MKEPGMSDFVTSAAKTENSSQTDGMRQWRKERNIQKTGQTGNQRGILCRDDISGTVKAILRQTQTGEGRTATSSRWMLITSQGAGARLFHKRLSLAIVPPPLLPCQRARPRTLARPICEHFTSSSKANKPQYLRKQLFLTLVSVSAEESAGGESVSVDPPSNSHSRTVTLKLLNRSPHTQRNQGNWWVTEPGRKIATDLVGKIISVFSLITHNETPSLTGPR